MGMIFHWGGFLKQIRGFDDRFLKQIRGVDERFFEVICFGYREAQHLDARICAVEKLFSKISQNSLEKLESSLSKGPVFHSLHRY